MGLWKALREVFPAARHQRCRVHKTRNITNYQMTGVCPRRPQVRARGGVIENPASSSKTIQPPHAAARLLPAATPPSSTTPPRARHSSWPTALPGADAQGERAYPGTRITRAGAVRYAHDDQGRIILRQKPRLSRKPDTWHYKWDAEDRLVAVTTPDGARWRYLYDPLGRRISKQLLQPDGAGVAEETLFAWDGSTLCEQTTRRAPHAAAGGQHASGSVGGSSQSLVGWLPVWVSGGGCRGVRGGPRFRCR